MKVHEHFLESSVQSTMYRCCYDSLTDPFFLDHAARENEALRKSVSAILRVQSMSMLILCSSFFGFCHELLCSFSCCPFSFLRWCRVRHKVRRRFRLLLGLLNPSAFEGHIRLRSVIDTQLGWRSPWRMRSEGCEVLSFCFSSVYQVKITVHARFEDKCNAVLGAGTFARWDIVLREGGSRCERNRAKMRVKDELMIDGQRDLIA